LGGAWKRPKGAASHPPPPPPKHTIAGSGTNRAGEERYGYGTNGILSAKKRKENLQKKDMRRANNVSLFLLNWGEPERADRRGAINQPSISLIIEVMNQIKKISRGENRRWR